MVQIYLIPSVNQNLIYSLKLVISRTSRSYVSVLTNTYETRHITKNVRFETVLNYCQNLRITEGEVLKCKQPLHLDAASRLNWPLLFFCAQTPYLKN